MNVELLYCSWNKIWVVECENLNPQKLNQSSTLQTVTAIFQSDFNSPKTQLSKQLSSHECVWMRRSISKILITDYLDGKIKNWSTTKFTRYTNIEVEIELTQQTTTRQVQNLHYKNKTKIYAYVPHTAHLKLPMVPHFAAQCAQASHSTYHHHDTNTGGTRPIVLSLRYLLGAYRSLHSILMLMILELMSPTCLQQISRSDRIRISDGKIQVANMLATSVYF